MADQIEVIKGDNLFYFYFHLPFAYAAASSHLPPRALLFALPPLSLFRGLQTSQTTVLLALAAMPTKRMFKRVAVADATSKKEKTSGCARSAFSNSNLNKLKKAKAAEIRIPGNEVIPHPARQILGTLPFIHLSRPFFSRPRIYFLHTSIFRTTTLRACST
jgi:hypothetical protein